MPGGRRPWAAMETGSVPAATRPTRHLARRGQRLRPAASLENAAVCLFALDANKDFFFKQQEVPTEARTARAAAAAAAVGAAAWHEVGRRRERRRR